MTREQAKVALLNLERELDESEEAVKRLQLDVDASDTAVDGAYLREAAARRKYGQEAPLLQRIIRKKTKTQ